MDMEIERFFTIISGLITIIAIITPSITAIINNIHQSKMQRAAFLRKEKICTYNNFLDIMSSTLAPNSFSKSVSLEFKCAYSKVYLICNNKTHTVLIELNNYISENANDDLSSDPHYRTFYTKLVRLMRQELKEVI